MSDLDLDRLGDVWRQQPSASEMADLQRSAETVRRRARWAQRADVSAAILIAGAVLLFVLRNPEPSTMLVGSGAILLLLFSQMRQRKLRAAELEGLVGSSEEMLDQSIERLRQSLKRIRYGALTLGPALLVGWLLARTANLAAAAAPDPELRTILLVGGVALLAATAWTLAASYRQVKRELERLLALREAYRVESESSTLD
ncbi:hypothetical protein [Sphingosinicella terrae]|jgi:hypothetical protein|uniref:hypothetical protein n=1 Tax=Sphingosinicella terrae TaxID=2172047 RepID=UPI000E0D4C50|nr:hypothetical protein [Sphingosinicella terrae]